MSHDVFISYSSHDKLVADAACSTLENGRIRCWIAPRDVQAGRAFAGEITRAIQRSRVMVLVFSAHSNTSQQVLREVELAVNAHLHIVQFRIENAPPSDELKYYLSTRHWLDAMTPPLEQHLTRLLAAVQALLAVDDEQHAVERLPSHFPGREVELADATLFTGEIDLSSTPGQKSEFFMKLKPLLENFLSEKADDVIASMIEREAILPTGTGYGLAFPHGYRPYVKRYVVGVVRVPGGCDWDAADEKPVFTVLLYVGGGGSRGTQALRIMGTSHTLVTKILAGRSVGPPDIETFGEIISTVKTTIVNAGLSVSFVAFQ